MLRKRFWSATTRSATPSAGCGTCCASSPSPAARRPSRRCSPAAIGRPRTSGSRCCSAAQTPPRSISAGSGAGAAFTGFSLGFAVFGFFDLVLDFVEVSLDFHHRRFTDPAALGDFGKTGLYLLQLRFGQVLQG